MIKKILLAPAMTKGEGTGHLKRCLALSRKLKNREIRSLNTNNYKLEPHILTDWCWHSDKNINKNKYSDKQNHNNEQNHNNNNQHKDENDNITILNAFPANRLDAEMPWDLILLDRRATSLKDLTELLYYGPVVGLDEGGAARDFIPFLIDTIPATGELCKANISSINLLDLPVNRKNILSYPFRKILISFGGEDHACLSLYLLNEILKIDLFTGDKTKIKKEITLIEGPCFKSRKWPHDIIVIKNPPDLKNMLFKFDLVFTSYGLTCFEALAAGVPVILLNPTSYHRKLSIKHGLPEIGVLKPNIGKMKRLIRDKNLFAGLLKSVERIHVHKEKQTAGDSLEDLLIQNIQSMEMEDMQAMKVDKRSLNDCPACASLFNPSIARFRHKTYFRCKKCRLIYMVELFPASKKKYNKDYFSKEYKLQYGKTYLEDFEKIKKTSYRRLKTIYFLNRKVKGKKILDIGCAYGPFLKAAMEKGLIPTGLDVSSDAVDYVKREFKIACHNMQFEQYKGRGFDIITMWFVLEHFKNMSSILKKINQLLPVGGIFAFSTPNSSGISGKRSLEDFLEKSPLDHYSIWMPASAKKILKRFGFKIKRIINTGHHPERFPIINLHFQKNQTYMEHSNILWNITIIITSIISRILKLGDTFEVYAVKKADI